MFHRFELRQVSGLRFQRRVPSQGLSSVYSGSPVFWSRLQSLLLRWLLLAISSCWSHFMHFWSFLCFRSHGHPKNFWFEHSRLAGILQSSACSTWLQEMAGMPTRWSRVQSSPCQLLLAQQVHLQTICLCLWRTRVSWCCCFPLLPFLQSV